VEFGRSKLKKSISRSIQYKCEDFAEFVNVVSINASDNHLPIGELGLNFFFFTQS
jgi:membrane-bound inhibitor of C-type lysozyme